MSEYNRHKFAMEWMHGGGRDPNGRSLDEEIRIGKDEWMERQRVAQGGRIGFDSGQLVQPGPGRQGYQGPKGGLFSVDNYKAIAAEYDTVLQEAFDNRTLKNVPEFKEWVTTNHGEEFNKKHHRKAVTKHSKLQFDTTRNKLLDTLIDEANDGFKLVELKTLQKQAGFTGKTAFPPGKKIYGKLDTATDKMKKGFDHLFMDSNKPAVEMFDSMRQLQKLTGIEAAPSKFLTGYVPYEDSKGLIKRLSIPLSKQRLSKVPELTLGELQFRIDNKLAEEKLFSTPRKVTTETQIFDIVKRHVDQGGTEIEWLKAPTKTELGYPSYGEAKFKFKGQDQVYDMAELIKNAETDPNFKQFFKVQNDLKTLNSKIVIHPKKGTKIRFDKLMQEVYNYRTPYVMDHFGQVGKEPFSNLRILPYRINAAAASLSDRGFHEKFITDPAKKGKYSIEGKKQALEKIGYNFQRNADDLFKAEFKLAEDILKRGRILRTPHQIVDSIREVKLSKTKDFLKLAPKKSLPVSYGLSSNFAAQFDDAVKSGKFKGARNFLKGELWFAALDYINSRTKGQSHEKALGKALEMASWGLKDLGADETALIKHATEQGASEEEIGALRNYLNYMKKYQSYETANKMLHYAKENLGQGTGSPEDIGTTWDDVTDAAQNLKLRENELRDLQATYEAGFEGTPDMMLGKNTLTKYIDSLAAEEWNKTAGTIIDRGSRPNQGEGLIWGGVGALTRDIGALATGQMPTNFWDWAVPAQIDPWTKDEKQIRLMERPAVGTNYPEYDLAREDMNLDFDYALKAEGGIASLKK